MGCLCDQCVALCCRYFAMEIDEPETRSQFDDVRWYLVHENVVVFVEKKKWYVGIMNRCKHLQPDNRCGIYDRRPGICRSYSTDNCEYHGGDYGYSNLFTSAEQLEKHAEELLGRSIVLPTKKPRKRRSKRPAIKGRLVKRSEPRNGKPAAPSANGNGRLSLPVIQRR